MSVAKQCRQCGERIPPHAKWGLCPRCVLDPSQDDGEDDITSSRAVFGEGGRCFADYEIGRQIGRGGMGVVYEAVQISLNRSVAFKMILDVSSASPVMRRRFAIEAEAAAKLDHPNIVPIYELGQYRGNPYLSMKLVQGESLRAKIARGEFCVARPNEVSSDTTLRQRENRVARFMVKVARAVHHAHQNGVLHRDLKPANILVDQAGEPHITDFGLAKILDPVDGVSTLSELTIPGGFYGSPGYMPPEQATGQRVSKASDIHSLGAILYELMTGQPPYKADTPLETIKMTLDHPPKRPRSIHRGLDKDLETICLKCLEKHPDARYESAEDLASDLERWLRKEPIRARPAGPFLRSSRWISRNPIGTGLIITLFIALTVSLVLLRLANRQKQRGITESRISALRISREIQKFWGGADAPFVEIESFDLDTLLGRTPRFPDTSGVNLTFGLGVNEEPLGQAMKYGPLLKLIEERMESSVQQPVFIRLRLYKMKQWLLHAAVASGEVDIARLSPLNYAQGKRINANLEPVVEEMVDKEAVIFSRKDLGLTSVDQIRGHTMVFAHTNSIISFKAKCALVRNGISSHDLLSYTNLIDEDHPGSDFDPNSDDEPDSFNDGIYAHKEVIEKVLAGEYDIGVARRRDFKRNKAVGVGLAELYSYEVPGDLHVARSGLPLNVVQAYRHVLRSLTGHKDKSIVAGLQGTRVEGFRAVSDADYQAVHRELTNELVRFELGDETGLRVRP